MTRLTGVAKPPAGFEPERVRAGWVGGAAALLHAVACLLVFLPDPHTGGDNATYISLGQALLGGDYADLWDPARRAHSLYPPVFPALLALAQTLGLHGFAALKMVTVGASIAGVGLGAAWATLRFGRVTGLLAAMMLALMPGVLEQSHWVLSDVPFWAFTALTLLALEARSRGLSRAPAAADGAAGAAGRRQASSLRVWGALAVVGTVLAYLTRSAGLPLVLAVAAHLALRRDWRLLAALAAVIVPAAVAWGVYSAGAGGGYGVALLAVDPYQPHLGTVGVADMVARVGDNVRRYGAMHLPLFLLGGDGTGAVLAALALVALALAGWAIALRRPGAPELFLPLYAGLLLVWPATWSGERFLLPVAPLLVGYAVAALLAGSVWLRLPRRRVALAAGALALLVLSVSLARRARVASGCRAAAAAGERLPCTPAPWRDLLLLAEDLRGRLPDGSVVLSRKPQLFYVLSGYPSRLYPMSDDPATFFAAAREAGADWVVLDQSRDLAYLYLHPVLLAARDEFCVVTEPSHPDAVLLRIDPDGPPRAPGAEPNAFRICPLVAGR